MNSKKLVMNRIFAHMTLKLLEQPKSKKEAQKAISNPSFDIYKERS